VLVQQQKVPDAFVKPVVTEDLTARLATMQEQILSRTRLQPIIERFSLFKDEDVPMEAKVEEMRKSIVVSPVKTLIASRTGGLPGFYITFTTDNARLAQQVCGEITSMFMSENLRAREQSAQGTTDFLTSQLDEAKRNLDQQDAKLATFKEKYVGQLPSDVGMTFNLLSSLNTQLEATTQALTRQQQDKIYLESLLNQQLAGLNKGDATNTQLTLELQLSQLQAGLVRLEARYTPDYPDVTKTKADIAALKAKLQQDPEATSKSSHIPSEPLQIQQMRAQLHAMELAINTKKQEQERIQKQIQIYQARLQLSPRVEEQYKAVSRDYQIALQFYNDLLAKKTQSVMATDLEKRQQGEQFLVMDPPNLPEKPTFPNRPLFGLSGLAGGLALGIAVTLLMEFSNKSIRTQRDIELYLNLPTLAMVPIINGALQTKSANATSFLRLIRISRRTKPGAR
jgi:protein tyrosine kinase modulator